MWETNEGIIRSVTKNGSREGGKSGIVPSHHKDLYEVAIADRSEEEKITISALLQKYSHAFSENDQDIGHTNVVYNRHGGDQTHKAVPAYSTICPRSGRASGHWGDEETGSYSNF